MPNWRMMKSPSPTYYMSCGFPNHWRFIGSDESNAAQPVSTAGCEDIVGYRGNKSWSSLPASCRAGCHLPPSKKLFHQGRRQDRDEQIARFQNDPDVPILSGRSPRQVGHHARLQAPWSSTAGLQHVHFEQNPHPSRRSAHACTYIIWPLPIP